MARLVEALLSTLIRALAPARPDWAEAILGEARTVPAGQERLSWLLGGVRSMAREVGMTRLISLGVCAGVLASAALVGVVLVRYPKATDGAGTPIFAVALVALLAGYAWAAALAARQRAFGWPATVAGLVAGVLYAAGTPAGGSYHAATRWLDIGYRTALVLVVVAPPVLAGLWVTGRTGRIEYAVAAGAWTGLVGALVNLVVGLALVLLMPSRVPLDPSVLRHGLRTPSDIMAGNVGEDLAGFIAYLLFGPALGAVLGLLGAAAAGVAAGKRSQRPNRTIQLGR
jgi:hypothetical protein